MNTHVPFPLKLGLEVDIPTYSGILSEAGYRLEKLGKWHVHPRLGPTDYGYDFFIAGPHRDKLLRNGIEYRSHPDSEMYIEFETGSTILAMNTREDVKELTGLSLTEGVLQSSHFELGFVVEDVEETIEQLKEQGVKVLVEPIVKPWGQTIAYIADPDGNYIEICSSLE